MGEGKWMTSFFFPFFCSRSGKTRSLYELLCRAYGIYFSLNTENNLGSRDMDTAIADLSFNLVLAKANLKKIII